MAVSTKRPTTSSIYNLGRMIIKRMFSMQWNGYTIKYNEEDIYRLLNFVSRQQQIPSSMKHPWGDAILSVDSAEKRMKQIGTRGTKLQQQNKQSLVSGLMVLDTNNNIMNKKLLDKIVPHKSRQGGNDFTSKCKEIRISFDNNNSKTLCIDKKYTRNS